MSNLTGASLMPKSPPFEASATGARLAGEVQSIAALHWREREQMYALLASYFANTSREQFERDLAEKEWAIVLRDVEADGIQGFSTLMRYRVTLEGEPIVVFFSGDTIIRREYWGETALPRLWGRHVFSVADTIADARVYWFLICSGYKTYRYLPLFFREFHPNCETPASRRAKLLLARLGRLKFGGG